MIATYGDDMTNVPRFKFNLQNSTDIQDIANIIKTLSDAGYEVNSGELSSKLGFRVFKKDFQGGSTND